MLVRTSLVLFALLGLSQQGCSRSPEPTPSAAAAGGATAPGAATSQAAKPVELPGPSTALAAPASRHATDMPDQPVAHPPSDNAKQIKAWQILIAYKGAQDADPTVTRSREEAKALAEHVNLQARAGANFPQLVAKYSDDPKAKLNKGNLGELTRSSMVKPFTDAAFALAKQEITYEPVETVFGFHVIKRSE